MLKTLQRWLGPRPAHDSGRWVVLDVESSGLDTRNDRLLAIAAIAATSCIGVTVTSCPIGIAPIEVLDHLLGCFNHPFTSPIIPTPVFIPKRNLWAYS